MSGAGGAGGTLTELPFAGRTAIVLGGGRGLGLAVAEGLAVRGADVALLDLLPDVSEVAAELARSTGRGSIGVSCDVTDESSVAAAFEAVSTALGGDGSRPADLLVNAAGIAHVEPALEVDAAAFRRVLDINLTGTFLSCRAFARPLVAAGRPGAIVNFGSMSGYVANRPQDQAAYNASKAGVTMLTKSLAVEWVGHGIRVNSIAPGYMASAMTRQFTDVNPDTLHEWERRTPMGRMGQPHEIVPLVCLLLSDDASYITGQDYLVDGGYTLV